MTQLGPLRAAAAFMILGAMAACAPQSTGAPLPTQILPAATPLPATPPLTAVPTVTLPALPASREPAPTTLALSPTPSPAATLCAKTGEVLESSLRSAVAVGDHAYRIYYPPCYGQDGRAYPTLYLFAGNIHSESKWDELGIDEAANAAIAGGEIPPLLIVMPAGGWLADDTSGGPGSYESLVLDELIPHIEQTTCAWAAPQGRAIGGLSRGGYWALEIAFRFPGQFLSAGGHSAALLDSFAGPDVNPQQTALTNDLGDLRVYLDIGAEDFLRTNTIRLHDEMVAGGVAHEWRLNEGQHNDAYWAAHAADYLHWYAAPWPIDRTTYPPCPRS